MTEKLFSSVLTDTLTLSSFLICSAVSIVLGFLLALTHLYKNKSTKSFTITIAMLPLIVQMIIMLVNGNLGTGLAVAGAFSLVRFRSVPGSAKEILSIFMAMAVGLGTGVRYIGVSILFTLFLVAFNFLYTKIDFADTSRFNRELKMTVPENLNYTEAFDDVFKIFTKFYRLKKVKTTNMGSLYQLSYDGTAVINGGATVIVGSSGMAQGFSENSKQASVLYNLSSIQNSGTAVSISNGQKVIASFIPSKQYKSIVISSPDIIKGESYTLSLGGSISSADKNGFTTDGTVKNSITQYSVKLTRISTSIGSSGNKPGGGFGGGFGGNPRGK